MNKLSAPSASASDRSISKWWFLAITGLVLRLLLYLVSAGSRDIVTWRHFAELLEEGGFKYAYEADPLLNHPPLAVLYSWVALKLSEFLGISFQYLFKFLPFIADIGSAMLIGGIYRSRGQGFIKGFALYALFIPAIIISSFHGNTDTLCLFFLVLSGYFFEIKKNTKLSAVALAAAINVKIIPILLVPLFFSLLKRREDFVRFFAWLAIGAMPFIVTGSVVGSAFWRNIFAYRTMFEVWGVNFLLFYGLLPFEVPITDSIAFSQIYSGIATKLIVGSILLLAAIQFRKQRFDIFSLMALGVSLFLIFAQGFGIQYIVYVCPLILLLRLRFAQLFHLVAGTFCILCYVQHFEKWVPLKTWEVGTFAPEVALAGAITWTCLLLIVVKLSKCAAS